MPEKRPDGRTIEVTSEPGEDWGTVELYIPIMWDGKEWVWGGPGMVSDD